MLYQHILEKRRAAMCPRYAHGRRVQTGCSASHCSGSVNSKFDSLGGKETSQGITKTKTLALSNNRFNFTCKKSFLNPNPPVTSCTLTIRAGDNTGDLNTFISKSADRKVAILDMSQTFAMELDKVFPGDSSGMVNFFLKTDNEAGLEVKGASWGNMTIGFSSN